MTISSTWCGAVGVPAARRAAARLSELCKLSARHFPNSPPIAPLQNECSSLNKCLSTQLFIVLTGSPPQRSLSPMPKPKPKTQASSAQARSIRALESSDEEEPQQPLVNNDVVLIDDDGLAVPLPYLKPPKLVPQLPRKQQPTKQRRLLQPFRPLSSRSLTRSSLAQAQQPPVLLVPYQLI